MFLVSSNRSLNVLKSATPGESLVLHVNFSVLIVDLHLVEALVTHAVCVDDKAALGERVIILLVIHVVTFIYTGRARPVNWEGVGSWRFHKEGRAQFTLSTNENNSPIEEATLPELAKVDRNADFVLCH